MTSLSYARTDLEIVRGLVAGLRERGKACWVDLDGIAVFAEWMSEIRVAINSSGAVLVAVSPALAA